MNDRQLMAGNEVATTLRTAVSALPLHDAYDIITSLTVIIICFLRETCVKRLDFFFST